MKPAQFWNRADDIHNLYHGKFRHAILTDDELQETVTEYIQDIMSLMGDWYNTQSKIQEDKQR